MIRRFVLVTVLILMALGALTGLGYHALNKWAQGLEGARKGEYADITVQLQTEIKAGLDAFLQKEENRPYTDYLYYHMPDNALTLSQQQQAAPLVQRSPLSGQLDQGLAYGHFQIEPDNRITTPNDDIEAREGQSWSNAKVSLDLDQWRESLQKQLLPELKQNLSQPQTPKSRLASRAQKSLSPRVQMDVQNLAIDSLQNTSQKSQMFQQNRAIYENNVASNTFTPNQRVQPQQRKEAPMFQSMASPDMLKDMIEIRVEPFVPSLLPNDNNTPSIFGGQILMLRHVQVEDKHYVQGFRLNEAELIHRIEGVTQKLMALHRGLSIKVSNDIESNACTSAVLDFGFGSLVLNLFETNPGWIHDRVIWFRRWYGVTLVVVLAAITLGLVSLWRGVHQQLTLSRQKDDFISAVSHELRTPLTAIRMYAEMLEKDWVKTEDKRQHYYTNLRQESERLSRLIDNVLDFSRIQRQKKQYHFELGDLNACIQQVVEMMTPFAAQHGFSLNTDLTDLASQTFDKDAITQIVVNLVDNAIKYAKDSQDKTICIRTFTRDQHTILEVEDHGPGIPHAQQRHIFDPFYRTENESTRQTQGTGLGLALVKRFTEAHQGTIEILNAQPTGALFRVTLCLGVRG